MAVEVFRNVFLRRAEHSVPQAMMVLAGKPVVMAAGAFRYDPVGTSRGRVELFKRFAFCRLTRREWPPRGRGCAG